MVHRLLLALDLADFDRVNSAIYYEGWLVGAREPPLGVAITADGVRLLEERKLYLKEAAINSARSGRRGMDGLGHGVVKVRGPASGLGDRCGA